MGRPSKFTPETRALIINACRAGNTLADAAANAGVDDSALYDWLARGRKASRGPYFEFGEQVRRARAKARMLAVGVIRQCFTGGFHQRPVYEPDGITIRTDASGEPITRLAYDKPDANLALKFLACSDPEHWAAPSRGELRVTHTGDASHSNDSGLSKPELTDLFSKAFAILRSHGVELPGLAARTQG